MPPSSSRASSSRNSQSSRIRRNAFTAAGPSRFCTFRLERSAGLSHATPAPGRLTVATLALLVLLHIWSIIHPLLDRRNVRFANPSLLHRRPQFDLSPARHLRLFGRILLWSTPHVLYLNATRAPSLPCLRASSSVDLIF